MRVGVFLSAQFEPDQPVSDGVHAMLQQAAAADELGYDTVFLGHHYLAHSAFLQPLSLAAYLARATTSVRLGFGVLLAPLYNPLALAEELATLDVLSNGRVTVGLGAGYRRKECDAFAVEWGDRLRRLRDYVPLLRALWSGESVSAEGSWGRLVDAGLALRPVQPGGPPLWVGAFAEPAIRRAARLDTPWLMAPDLDDAGLTASLALYRDVLVEHGFSLRRPYPLAREACVADTHEAAVAQIRPHLERQYAAYKSWETAQQIDVDSYIENSCLVGTADEVVERIEALRSVHGITDLSLRVQFMGAPHAQALEQIERIGRDVIPKVG